MENSDRDSKSVNPLIPKKSWRNKLRWRFSSFFRKAKDLFQNLSAWIRYFVAILGGIAVIAAGFKGLEYFLNPLLAEPTPIEYPSMPLKNGGFERGSGQPQISTVIGTLGSVPTAAGIWGGDKGEIVGTYRVLNDKSDLIGTVSPFGGSAAMLRFLNTNAVAPVSSDHPKANLGKPDAASDNDTCQILQIIDLKPYAEDMKGEGLQAKATAYFHWYSSTDFENEDPIFRIDLTAHAGEISEHNERLRRPWYAANGWNGESKENTYFLARAKVDFRAPELTTIENGWIKLETPFLNIPYPARYLTIELIAQEEADSNDVDGIEFPAHFVDNVSIEITRVRR